MKRKRPAARKKSSKTRRPVKRSGKSPSKSKASTRSAKPIGVVTHFFTQIKVAIVKFKQPVSVGKEIRFHGATTDFKQVLKSMQYDHKPVTKAPKGKQIGIKVSKRVREGDSVFVET